VKQRGITALDTGWVKKCGAKAIGPGMLGEVGTRIGYGDKRAAGIGGALGLEAGQEVQQERVRFDVLPDLLAKPKRGCAKSSCLSMARTAAGSMLSSRKTAPSNGAAGLSGGFHSEIGVVHGDEDDVLDGVALRDATFEFEPGGIGGQISTRALVGRPRGNIAGPQPA